MFAGLNKETMESDDHATHKTLAYIYPQCLDPVLPSSPIMASNPDFLVEALKYAFSSLPAIFFLLIICLRNVELTPEQWSAISDAYVAVIVLVGDDLICVKL